MADTTAVKSATAGETSKDSETALFNAQMNDGKTITRKPLKLTASYMPQSNAETFSAVHALSAESQALTVITRITTNLWK
jgi:hypothetical protein